MCWQNFFAGCSFIHRSLLDFEYGTGGVTMDSNLDLSSNTLLAPRILNSNFVPKNRMARVLDISMILLAAPYILLAFLVIIILIKLDSKGPVFYRQARIGRHGRKF
jgi:lipopolysaccharide/colanic/teichoic acid biosynthesis glycosyltransferase